MNVGMSHMENVLAGFPYADGELVRGEIEVRCPRCGKWEPMVYGAEIGADRDYGITTLTAELRARSGRHDCNPPKVTVNLEP